ncbi:hypothetical protein PHLGIDRAFT_126460 [Phlebiopsis gigantea 11061_1 CR5-6]|uniref:Inhibitor I9 domain-containing protein n=1 Tax=Phlebiopsis gigantea (strain 11061_1 CR5-6) TaxID=745531 RepID=A0A0C3SAF1_PHLG1|nr:hypothetical protein PHLGIDRAFT_126460 [Phlebiopsis gigantea 11061_1 CR5-6]
MTDIREQGETLLKVHRATGRKAPSSYIVQLKDEADKNAHLEWLRRHLMGDSKITNEYSIIKAYSGTFDEETLTEIRKNKDVKRIEEDVVFDLDQVQEEDDRDI